MSTIRRYWMNGRFTIISGLGQKMVELTGFTSAGNTHSMALPAHSIDSLIKNKQLIEDKPTNEMDKLEYYKQFYPDAKEYNEKNQKYIREDEARLSTYGADVNSKVLFYRDIPNSSGVRQQFIFSEKAYLDEEKLKVHQEQLMEPYH